MNIATVIKNAAEAIAQNGEGDLVEFHITLIKGEASILGVFLVPNGDASAEREITAQGETPDEAAVLFARKVTFPREYDGDPPRVIEPVIVELPIATEEPTP